MRLSAITEAKLDIAWLTKALAGDTEAINTIKQIDPTGGEYYKWLAKIYKATPAIFNDTAKCKKLHDDLAIFDVRKQLAKTLGLSADLNVMNYEDFTKLIDKMRYHVAAQQSKSRGSGVSYFSTEYPGVEIIANEGNFVLFRSPMGNDKEVSESLQKLGIGTDWCTRLGANPNLADKYLAKANIYTLYHTNKPLYQMHVDAANLESTEIVHFKDVNNATPKNISSDAIAVLKSNIETRCCLILLGALPVDDALISTLIQDNDHRILGAIALSNQKRWPDATTRDAVEKCIMDLSNYDDDTHLIIATKYAMNAKVRDVDLEWHLLESLSPRDVIIQELLKEYISAMIDVRWPEAEGYLERFPILFMDYLNQVYNTAYSEELESLFIKSVDRYGAGLSKSKLDEMITKYCLMNRNKKWPEFNDKILRPNNLQLIAAFKQGKYGSQTDHSRLLAGYYDLPN